MNNDYRRLDIEVLKDFMEGEEHDVYLLIKKLYFKDMYMSLYEDSFKKLSNDDSLETFVETTFRAYRTQNKLNQCLKVRDGKYYDEFLIKCVASELYRRFPDATVVKSMIKEDFIELVIEREKNYLDNVLLNEYNIDFLISLLKDKFGNSHTANITEVIDYIYEISNGKASKLGTINTFEEYLNELIKDSNITLNQLGTESLIKKGIYDITMGKLPTKNHLIMISFALRLSVDKRLKLFELAKDKVRDKSNSNMYNFDTTNKRDKLILHWLNNIVELEEIAKNKNKYIVEVFNDILKAANFDVLK